MRLPGRREENLGLPTFGGNNQSKSVFAFKSRPGDGSARSIHVKAPIAQQWQRAPPIVKASWISIGACLFLMFFGYRNLRYYHTNLNINCTSRDCHLKLAPVGRTGSTRFNFSRLQLITAYPIRMTKDGKYVDNTPDMNEPRRDDKKKKKKYSNYKGPDTDGYYLSYAIIFKDKDQFDANITETVPEEEWPQDLSKLYPYADKTEEGLRFVVGQFKRGVTKRRTRTMVQKITSYINKRRSKLLVKESSTPSWVGVLSMVMGLVGFLLTVLLGQFWEDDLIKNPLKGPGVRRSANDRDSMARATPARYEVTTEPKKAGANQTVRKRY